MTVHELIAKLQEFEPNYSVRITDENWEGREKDIDDVELTENYGEGNYVVLNIS